MKQITPIKSVDDIKREKPFFHSPFFRAPAEDVFEKRAKRFAQLAEQDKSEWSAYLALLADISKAQQNLLAGLDAQPFTPTDSTNLILVAADGHYVPANFSSLLKSLLEALGDKVPAKVQTAIGDASDDELVQLARYSLGATETELKPALQEAVIWARAACQVVWTAWAQQLSEDDVPAVKERGHCPCCGTEAVSSIVGDEADVANLRYMHCPTCNSQWNALRAKCTFCEAQSGMALQRIEDDSAAEVYTGACAETCDECHGYRKLFLTHEQEFADPIADDLASLALDILVGEDGFNRGGRNPFLVD